MPQQNQDQFEKTITFNPKIIRRGIFLFIGITILTFAAIFLYTDGAKNLSVWKQIDWKYLVAGLIFVAIDSELLTSRNLNSLLF